MQARLSNCSDASPKKGLQLGELLDQIIEYWRGLMLLNCAGKDFADLPFTDANRDKAYQHAKTLPLDTILAGLDILTSTKSRLRSGNHGLILLEMAILRLIRFDELLPVAQLAQMFAQPGSAPPARPASALPNAADAAKKNSTLKPEPSTNGKGVAAAEATARLTLAEVWVKVLETVGPFLGGNLDKAGLPAILGPKSLVIRFGNDYTSQSDFCSEPQSVNEIQKALRTVTGDEWIVRVERSTVDAITPEQAETKVQAVKPVTYRERSQEVLQMPLISRAVDKLGARLLKIDDGFGTLNVIPRDVEILEVQEP